MRDRLEETVAEFIRRQGLFAGAGRILLAVSGGADSTALLHILVALRAQGSIRPELVCAHINHRLRGPASDADEHFVIEQANQLGLPVVVRVVNVRAHVRAHRLSLETAARQLRLAGLGEIARERGCPWVCTGHQKNDNAETVLHRLWRGTGFRGLAGIRPARQFGDVWFASPLLRATRREIVQYLEARALRWREDLTNVDMVYTRNYIRHRLLPFLQQEAQGDLVKELSELAASAGKLCDRVEREAGDAWSRLVASAAGEIVIQAAGLVALPELVAVELIRRAIADLAPDGSEPAAPHYRAVLELARTDGGGKGVVLPGGLIVRREAERIVLSRSQPASVGRVGLAPPTSAATVLVVPGKTSFAGREIEARICARDEIDMARLRSDKGPSVEYLDWDQVKPPVVVRTRRPGDRFQPLGMTDEKKVGKFLTTAKVSRDLRERLLVLADRDGIIWVYPVRISERVKITAGTRRVLQLTIRNA
jgi:tRNA(Ile)-lysidine synthase